MKSKSLFSIFFATSILILAAMFYLFDGYISDVGNQTVRNWIKTESNLIAEGNLLTSVTKMQHLIGASDYVKGVVLIDNESETQKEQIVLGESISADKVTVPKTDVEVKTVGFFKKLVTAKIPNKKMTIALSVWSENINRMFFVTSAMFILLFSFCVGLIRRVQTTEFQKREVATKLFAEKAARVAHDVRAPLMVVSSLVDDLRSPTEQVKLESAVSKLIEVVDELVDDRQKKIKKSTPKSTPESCFTFNLGKEIARLIESKNIQHGESKAVKICGTCSFDVISARLSPLELNRTLSNLIDNAVDACTDNGIIKLEVSVNGQLEIKITDNGRGISQDLLTKIGEKGFTHGKTYGSGLGLFYAKKSLADIGGSLLFDSKEDIGTIVTIRFPIFYVTSGGSTNLLLPKDVPIFILDDSEPLLGAWELLLKDTQSKVSYFSSPYDLIDDLKSKGLEKWFLLIDYELQKDLNGLDVVEHMGLESQSILVTSQDFDKAVQNRAKTLGVPILGKDRLVGLTVVMV